MVWRKKWKKLLIAPFILSLFSCSKNVQITFTAAKYIRGYYDYEKKVNTLYFEKIKVIYSIMHLMILKFNDLIRLNDVMLI